MKLKLLILSFVLAASATLRFINYEGRTNYGFDQSRDIAVLDSYVATKRLPLLGPIVRGDIGGFYLGPLYHYLLIPLYDLSSHNPLSLVYFSILVDVAVALALTLIISPSAGIIWAFSSLLINSSLTPWNVSLIHGWILLCLYYLARLNKQPSLKLFLIFCFTLGVSSSIHLTLLPLVGIYLLMAIPLIRRYPLGLLAIIPPQLPLIISDLTHGAANARAFKDFLFVHTSANNTTIWSFVITFTNKLGFTVSRLFLGEPYLGLGLLFTAIILVYGMRHYRENTYVKYSLITILVVFLSLFLYRDLDFAEYYFNAALVPLVIIFSYYLQSFKRVGVVLSILLILIVSNYASLNFATGRYSMLSKKQLVANIAGVAQEGVDLHLLLNEQQQFGFHYYLKQMGIDVGSHNRLKLVIAPVEQDHISAPEDAPSIIYQTSHNAFHLVVFSN